MYIFNQLEATALLSLSGDLTNQSAPNMLVRHEGVRCQRVQIPPGKLSVHPGSYPDSGLERSSC